MQSTQKMVARQDLLARQLSVVRRPLLQEGMTKEGRKFMDFCG